MSYSISQKEYPYSIFRAFLVCLAIVAPISLEAQTNQYTFVINLGNPIRNNLCFYEAKTELDTKQLGAEVSKGSALPLKVVMARDSSFDLLQPATSIFWVLPKKSSSSVQDGTQIPNLSDTPHCFVGSYDLEKKRAANSKPSMVLVTKQELQSELSDLPKLLTQVRGVPYFKDGLAIGLRLFAIRSGSLFERLGFQNGDIVLKGNNTDVADISQLVRLFENLQKEQELELKLERGRELVLLKIRVVQ